MTPLYDQVQLLAMELDRSHVGALVQIITEEWSMTGTLTRVDQHDNREWDIDYANGRRLVPSGGEIYAELWIGPWRGHVIGNQPVTVERVAGTLEAPERTSTADRNLDFIRGEIERGIIHKDDARSYLLGEVVDDLPPAPPEWPDLPGQG